MVMASFESVSVEIVVLPMMAMVTAMVMVTMVVAMPSSVIVMVAYKEQIVRLNWIWEM